MLLKDLTKLKEILMMDLLRTILTDDIIEQLLMITLIYKKQQSVIPLILMIISLLGIYSVGSGYFIEVYYVNFKDRNLVIATTKQKSNRSIGLGHVLGCQYRLRAISRTKAAIL